MSRAKVIHSSPQDIEQAFYEALEAADLEALMDLWADDEHVVCIHPGGPRVEGYHDVRDSDAIIAANPDQVAAVKEKPKTFGWFVGQVMKATGGKANPAQVNALVARKLGL